jgi:[ribosomal protein S18]-alanine N-acetyltransferase
MNVREASESDIEDMMRLANDSPTAAHWTRAAYERMFTSEPDDLRYIALVAEETQGKLVGFIVGRAVPGVARGLPGEDDWEIENMVVAESERRQGFGSALVAELLRRARGKSTCRFWLEVRASNVAAIALYRKFGFEEESRRKSYYSHPTEDALVLALKLREQTLEELQE